MATIEINGEKYEAELGRMVIEVADEAGIHIPRFCYHKKLTVAANCRMCLVEVDNARKPMPACATPVSDGMKVFTQSPMALAAQKSVMEFLLINHPLDCPICDQGGECELQDVSMGYGEDVSQYSEGKRSIDDEDIGSLIATDMTRCIHCTRCVRFGEEIAGVRELGATGRGEDMRIGTYVEHSLQSPVAGNIIDLCPVGALTSKPFRYRARAWELQTKPSISPHDCLGSHLNVHVRRQQVMRVVPRESEEMNACWLSDRDRFSYTGINHADRVTRPMIKENGRWTEVSWPKALEFVVNNIKHVCERSPKQLGVLTSPSSTLEEQYLLQKICRGMGSHNIDHRLHEVDFSDQAVAPLFPGSTLPINAVDRQQAIFVVGSHLAQDVPLLATRVHQARLNEDHTVMTLNAMDYPTTYPVDAKIITDIEQFGHALAEVAVALSGEGEIPDGFEQLFKTVSPGPEACQIAENLHRAERAVIISGFDVQNHPMAASLRSLIKLIGQLSGASLMQLTEGANAAGAWLAGAVPHRLPGGGAVAESGMDSFAMFTEPRQMYVLHQFEPEADYQDPQLALAALQQAQCVCVISPYRSHDMLQYADVILPSSVFTETSGTTINLSGHWQTFNGCTQPFGEARPGWKILRVLGNLLNLDGFDYRTSREVLSEVSDTIGHQSQMASTKWYYPTTLTMTSEVRRLGRWAIYKSDPVLRRAEPLQQAASQDPLAICVSPQLAERFNLRNGKSVTIMQSGHELSLPVSIDPRVSENSVYFVSGYVHPQPLGAAFGVVELK